MRRWTSLHPGSPVQTYSLDPCIGWLFETSCWRRMERWSPPVLFSWHLTPLAFSRSVELRTQKLKSHLMRTQNLTVLTLERGVGQYIAMHATLTARDLNLANFLPFQSIHLHFFPKPGIGQYIAMHATLTARDLFLANFRPFQSIHLHFFQNLSKVFPLLAVANTGSCVGQQNKIGHPAGCRFQCWVLAEYE